MPPRQFQRLWESVAWCIEAVLPICGGQTPNEDMVRKIRSTLRSCTHFCGDFENVHLDPRDIKDPSLCLQKETTSFWTKIS